MREGKFVDYLRLEKVAKKLTARGRKQINPENFVFPERAPRSGSYPIHDLSHARSALSMVSAHGTPAEKARVRATVYRKYPQLRK